MLESAFTFPPPSSQEQKLELRYFHRNQHTAFEESGIAETARLSISDEVLEAMNESTQMSIFMGGGIDRDRGAFFAPCIRFQIHSNCNDGDQTLTYNESVAVGNFYIETDELETGDYFTEEEFYQVLDMVKGIKQAKILGILPNLSLNLVGINTYESERTQRVLESTEEYLDKLAA